jgi:hypothetical protein
MLNTKFQKILNKCITEGKMKLNPSLSKKSIRLIKLSSFLNTMKDI